MSKSYFKIIRMEEDPSGQSDSSSDLFVVAPAKVSLVGANITFGKQKFFGIGPRLQGSLP